MDMHPVTLTVPNEKISLIKYAQCTKDITISARDCQGTVLIRVCLLIGVITKTVTGEFS